MTAREQVTVQQVYEIMNRLEDKIDHSLDLMTVKTDTMSTKINRIDNSLSFLQGKIIGVSAVISAVIAIVVAFIESRIK